MLHSKYQHLLTDDMAVKEVAQEILEKGFVALENFLEPVSEAKFQEVARDTQKRNKKGEELIGTVVHELGHSDEVLQLSQRLYDARCAITGEDRVELDPSKQLVGMPYKDGSEQTQNKITAYHYDGAYINLLLPLILPTDQKDGSGNLVMFPNLRQKYPALITKVFSRMLRHSRMLRKLYGQTEVIYDINTMYIFFGDISFHGVEPISNGERVVVTINSHW